MIRRLAVFGAFYLFAVPPMWSQTSNDQILQELKAIRESQQAIQKELQEIRKLVNQPRAAAPDVLPKDPINVSKDPAKGERGAKVAMIEYSDYQCPFCSRFGKDAYPQIETDFIKTGKLQYYFRDLPLDFHKEAFKAAEAAHCSGEQGKFWEMHDRLFANQKELGLEHLARHAEALSLDTPKFQQCLDSSRYAEDIRRDIRDANSAGISGTPTFLIGTINPDGSVTVRKKVVGARPYADFRAAIDEVLAGAD